MRAEASDAHSALSATPPGSRGSRLLRTDSLDYTPTSLTPQVTPPASETLFSQDSASDSDRSREDDDLDSDAEAKVPPRCPSAPTSGAWLGYSDPASAAGRLPGPQER